jgi:hypothetical protein
MLELPLNRISEDSSDHKSHYEIPQIAM